MLEILVVIFVERDVTWDLGLGRGDDVFSPTDGTTSVSRVACQAGKEPIKTGRMCEIVHKFVCVALQKQRGLLKVGGLVGGWLDELM